MKKKCQENKLQTGLYLYSDYDIYRVFNAFPLNLTSIRLFDYPTDAVGWAAGRASGL